MALKVVLKPGEQLYVGTSRIIVASDQYVTFIIEGGGPVLRERDYLQPATVSSKADQVCLTLQTIYLTGRSAVLIDQYRAQVQALLGETPVAAALVAEINAALDGDHSYGALKAARGLVKLEEGSVDPG